MSELKTIVTQETKDLIDAAVERARTAVSSATTSVEVAETKASEARASYEAILAEESTLLNTLLSKTSLTEEEFLKVVNAGKQSSLKLNTEITLPNNKGNSNVWLVAGKNHDNTSGTVDLISKNLIQDSTIGAYTTNSGYWGSSNAYTHSYIRQWLTSTFIMGFSTAVQKALKVMEVGTDLSSNSNITILNDKVKLLSMIELGISKYNEPNLPSNYGSEGETYPIFEAGVGDTAKTKRIKYGSTGSVACKYWTRTRDTNLSGGVGVYTIYSNGNHTVYNCTDNTIGIVPVIRF